MLALLGACHPAPAAAVSVITTVLVVAAGNRWPVCVLAALAITTGQLSIGWSNDLIDADRDVAAGRRDKPAAQGAVSRATLRRASAGALLATVVFSLALGWRSGAAQLVMVASGWSYNLGLKGSPASAVPYFVGFGALPAMATLATDAHRWPPAWTMVAAGLIGVGAHFGNVLPDIGADRQAGSAACRSGSAPTARRSRPG